MTEDQMLAVAAEVGFSETALLFPGAERVRARYVSPLAEVCSCGHAAIAAAIAARQETPGPVAVFSVRR